MKDMLDIIDKVDQALDELPLPSEIDEAISETIAFIESQYIPEKECKRIVRLLRMRASDVKGLVRELRNARSELNKGIKNG